MDAEANPSLSKRAHRHRCLVEDGGHYSQGVVSTELPEDKTSPVARELGTMSDLASSVRTENA